jgi:NOL1/NOP2/fmu family ribosome biogenesis protein
VFELLKGLAKWRILNSKEIKALQLMIKQQWGTELDFDGGYLENTDGDIFLMSRDIEQIDLENLRVDSLGLYFGQLKNDEFRLSIEGSQLVGKTAKTNLLEISDEELTQWISGGNLEVKDSFGGHVIIKHKSDYVGCGKYKDNVILNFVPKARRINR